MIGGHMGGSVTRSRGGIWFAIGAYGLWGTLPAYFVLLRPSGAFEIVAWRVLFALVFCALLLTITKRWGEFRRVLLSPRRMLLIGLAAYLVLINWTIYVFGATTGHIVETALGYFINPVVTVLLGVIVLREKLRPAQWIAVGVSLVAIVTLTIDYGHVPVIALALALSFGAYGLAKNRVGASVGAVTSLAMETVWLIPAAIAMLVVTGVGAGLTFGTISPFHTAAMIGVGVMTAVPLLFFGAAASRLPLSTLGLVQYLTPVLQLLFGVVIMHEPMPLARWFGFGIVWLSLAILSTDAVIAGNRARRRTVTELC